MKKQLFIANRLREVLLNGRWIANTNYKEQLADISWEQAIIKINNLNSVAALTYHINYYLKGLLAAFETGKLEINDKFSFDLPEITGKSDWDELIADFIQNAEHFANKIERFDAEIFNQPFFDEKYGSYLRNIEGVIEHSYYHLGQIVLIKKIIMQ
ncbi:DinB family protein [Sphingobacterium sp.]|uniref:DinB family protein n=1 Tax=Sphingobacterium sp. TaxID=341027 RepID=UPI0031D35546